MKCLDISKRRVITGRIVRKGIWVWSEMLWILVIGGKDEKGSLERYIGVE